MTKSEALKIIRKEKGFIPNGEIYSLFKETDEIPQELIRLTLQNNSPYGYIKMSPKLAELIQEKIALKNNENQ